MSGRLKRITCTLVVAGLLTVSGGCSRAPGREQFPVAGRLLIDGALASHGTVSFRPLNARAGHQPTGVVDERGEYSLFTTVQPGAPPGEYRVLVFVHAQPEDAGAVRPSLPQPLVDPIDHDEEQIFQAAQGLKPEIPPWPHVAVITMASSGHRE